MPPQKLQKEFLEPAPTVDETLAYFYHGQHQKALETINKNPDLLKGATTSTREIGIKKMELFLMALYAGGKSGNLLRVVAPAMNDLQQQIRFSEAILNLGANVPAYAAQTLAILDSVPSYRPFVRGVLERLSDANQWQTISSFVTMDTFTGASFVRDLSKEELPSLFGHVPAQTSAYTLISMLGRENPALLRGL